MLANSIRTRRVLYAALGAAVLAAPVHLGVSHLGLSQSTAPRVLAECNDIVDTNGSFSMDCAPSVIPNQSDPLTEAEVSEPGWNAVPGGGAGPHH